MSSADAADYGFKRFRVSRACVVCRLRKTKCNGEQPCDRCKAHSAECKYDLAENVPRRTSRAGSTGRKSSERDSAGEAASSSDAAAGSAAATATAATDRPSKRQKRAMIDQMLDQRWGDRSAARGNSALRKSGYVLHHLELYASIDQDEPAEDEPELHTEDGIRAHDANTGNMQFYGFTSNFNFQHRLTQTIEALRLREQLQQPSSTGPNGTSSSERRRHSNLPESMKMWGHQNIIFRHSLSEAGFPTLDASKDAVGDSTFLPPSIVDRFIENYMTLIQPQLGAVPKRQILKWVKDAKTMGYLSRGFSGAPWTAASGPGHAGKQSSANGPAPMRTNELAALYVVLALGAMMDEGDWEDVYAPVPMAREGAIACATTLFLLAKKRLEEIVENSSIQSARCLLLMSFFSLQWSSPNVAYLYSGYAARMCISIGLHRETFYNPSNPRSAEHRQLWWTCYSVERMIATWFGQASAIRDDDVSTRLPQAENSFDAYLLVNAQIGKVCSDVAKLSSNPPTNAQEVLLASERMDAEMLRIRIEAPKELAPGLRDKFGNDADDDSDSSDLVVRRYSIATFWWYLRLLVHSPLVIFALYCRSAGTSIPASVLQSTNISARAGQQIIDAICNARSDMPRPGLDNMRFGSFYLDSACTIVLSAILCDPSNQELAFGYLASIDRAIKYLEKKDKIYADHGTRASLQKARDLVVLARQVVRAAAGQSASTRVQHQNGASRKQAAATAASNSVNAASVTNTNVATGNGNGNTSNNSHGIESSAARSGHPISTFRTSSERGRAADGSGASGDQTKEGPTRQDSSNSQPSRPRDRSMEMHVSSLLSPPSSSSARASQPTMLPPQPSSTVSAASSNPAPSGAPGQAKTYASERDDWMQYFLSNFDWLTPLSQPGSGGTPQATQSGSGSGSIATSDSSVPPLLGLGSMSSPQFSSPGSASGPLSLSELDIGLIMGGVSVMESDLAQQT
ncbi:hypothetical protein BCV70DRAFT_159417 [Testicularia cyperi]|uniref:Zn(2)-C6 fungal-type domain-containing protein n=1 Tax=Testicularia cyperi TaxID=1882483 RepID=A0A317XTZ8_9BASI|nr:hypothetical protein BCV70DRAFT_159417 [Testicularia cyperi]